MSATHPFRVMTPTRTYTGPDLASYQSYKKRLAKDFRKRCGYTDCPDFWFGGISTFHIDHFKPKSKYSHLERKYSNLVYTCSHVNQARGDDDADYLDPCDVDYNSHFGRDDDGNIIPLPGCKEADYMYIKLKFYLQRYGIIWSLESIRAKLRELRILIDLIANTDPKVKLELLEKQHKLSGMFEDYLKYLEASQ